ncbi:MhmaT1 transposase [Oopsacas minuta]|uniref:MhmaT1 transposase n=1 Tax=Oopsacas minuta TaxID=111878 RepID=A0AAV7JN53_9METZ|nr:MhmaT1 transposase [Oopsacas minuta]
MKNTTRKIRVFIQYHGRICLNSSEQFRRVNILNLSWFGQVYLQLAKTPLVFVPEGTKINAKVYQDLILDKYVRHIGSTFMKGEKWIFQQDGAPAHIAKSTLQWLSSNVPAFLGREEWPPSSPDLNPCDYYLWERLEAIVNNRSYNDIPSLKRALKRA